MNYFVVMEERESYLVLLTGVSVLFWVGLWAGVSFEISGENISDKP